ncbi:MAG TPA: hypothetical protein VHB97_07845 [Polyangia bacterium]|jgi:hypothetical protein|nr:hypothetical protein [Polyangia bacterium]
MPPKSAPERDASGDGTSAARPAAGGFMHIRIAVVAAAVLATAGCAPALVTSSMTNPARSKDKLSSTQEYDIGPYKENHRYTMTLKDWTPNALGVAIKVADIAECGQVDSYSFTLVDDKGGRHALTPVGAPTQTSEKGRGSATLTVTTLDGRFDVAIGADAQAVTIEQRPKPAVGCPALDFRWSFQ